MTEIVDGIPQPVVLTQEDIDVIGEIHVKATYFEIISSGTTSGQVSKPAGGGSDVSFVMDEWGVDTDALVTTVDGGKPTFRSPVDAGGNSITTTFDTDGNFVFSATPVPAADHAVVYVYKCFLKNFNADESIFETEIGAGGDHGLLTGLADDDHTQYLNLSRANTWFSLKDLADLGSKDHADLDLLGADDHTQYHTDARADTWFAGKDLADLGTKNHADLDLLGADDHSQYALLAGRNGGQTLIGGTLTTQNLVLQDNAVDANFLTLTQTGLNPDSNKSLGLGTTALNYTAINLAGDGGVGAGSIIKVPNAANVGATTNYVMELGGGFDQPATGGGDFTFQFSSAVAGGENICTFDLGAVYFLGGVGTTNDFVIACDNGLDVHRFIAKFGGWTLPEYGWALDRITGTGENAGKTLFFDNQEPYSDTLRSIDFRIDGTNVLTIENEVPAPLPAQPHTVDFPLKYISAPTGIVINRFCEIDSETIFNLIDVCNIRAVNPNAAGILSVKPKGTGNITASLCTNNESTVNYGTFENSLSGTIARLCTWRYNAGVGPTELRIGEMASSFFGIGLFGTLTTIDFYFNNAVEAQIQPDTMIFNNGAVDTQIDWATSGQLGLQVATNDILRLTATQVQIPSDAISLIFGAGLDASFIYNGTDFLIDVSLQNPSDINITCGANKTVELINTVWDDIRVSGLSVLTTGPNPPTLGAWLAAGGLQVYRFTGTGPNVNEVRFVIQLPHTYKEGTDIIPHVHWGPTDANAGNVVWQLEYSWANINATFPASTTIATPADPTSGTAWDHQVAPFAAITGTGKLISSMLVCRLFRDPAHGSDTYGFDAGLLEFDIHHEVNTMGSRQEFTK